MEKGKRTAPMGFDHQLSVYKIERSYRLTYIKIGIVLAPSSAGGNTSFGNYGR